MCGYPGTSYLLLLKRSLCVEVCKHVDKLTIHIQFCRLFLSFQGVVYQYTRGYRITGILRHPCPSVNSRILKHQMTSCFPLTGFEFDNLPVFLCDINISHSVQRNTFLIFSRQLVLMENLTIDTHFL